MEEQPLSVIVFALAMGQPSAIYSAPIFKCCLILSVLLHDGLYMLISDLVLSVWIDS